MIPKLITMYEILRYEANEAKAIGRTDEYIRLVIGAGKIHAQIQTMLNK